MNYPTAKRRRAYEKVADAIRGQILAGELKKGQKIPPERDLSNGFGVSRVVVREAIRTLEMAGILSVRKGSKGGTFVNDDYDKPLVTSIRNLLWGGSISLDHLFEIRLLLEPPAAALATQRAEKNEIDALEDLLTQTEKLRDDALSLRKGNLEFHRRLVSLAGNPLLTALCQTVLKLLVESMQDRLDLSISLNVLSFHWLVLKAVREGKPELAQSLLTEDLGVLHAKYQELGAGREKTPQAAEKHTSEGKALRGTVKNN